LRKGFIAREGFVFIVPSLILFILFLLFHLRLLSVASFLLFLFFLYFFRNPRRLHSTDPGTLISPADGRVVEAAHVVEDEFLGTPAIKVAIFMSPLDVHVNRAPCDGRVLKIEHRSGGFAAAYRKDSDRENERNYVLLGHDSQKVLVVQVAGFLARRIFCWVKEKDTIVKGEPFGMIAFGSRVDIYLPETYDCMVQLDERVKAGLTPIAVRRG
jgi:phosphatidylserine decarboxylase